MNDKIHLVSIIIPTYKGEKTITILIKELIEILKDVNFEILVINDDSPDETHKKLLELQNSNPEILTYIKLAKNVGEYNAVMAGLRNCKGDVAIIVDDDLQHPPSEIFKLIKFSKISDYDVVYTKFKNYNYSLIRSILSKFYNFTANIALNKPSDIYLSSFKSIKRKIINEIVQYEGNYAFIDGLIFSITKNVGTLEVNHEKRKVGSSGYSIKKFAIHYGNLILNFSVLPLRIFFIFGLIISLISFISLLFIIYEKINEPNIPIGYPTLIAAIVLFSGIQILFLGLIGEYLGKILKIINKDKQYIIDLIKKNLK